MQKHFQETQSIEFSERLEGGQEECFCDAFKCPRLQNQSDGGYLHQTKTCQRQLLLGVEITSSRTAGIAWDTEVGI